MWTQQEAITFCCLLESVAPRYGCHVALTGGLLYKEGARKDCDVIVYRIRQVERIDIEGLMAELATQGVERVEDFGFCYKAWYRDKAVDFLFPDRPKLSRHLEGGYR